MDFAWHRVESNYIVDDRWLRLRADSCRLPSGRVIEPYYVTEYPDWVNIVALTPEEQVVLVRQYRHGIGRTILDFPAGTLDPTDESPTAAAERELLEETGYAGEVVATGVLTPNAANHTNSVHCFLVARAAPVAEPRGDDTEIVEVVMELTRVIELATAGELPQAMAVSSLFLALHALRHLNSK